MGPPAAPRGFDWGRTVSAADLVGAKALAFAGGVVTLLGVVFFFVLAVNRGWMVPACGSRAARRVRDRVRCGLWLAAARNDVLGARRGRPGIAGGYATLLAAVSLYDLVSKPVALVVAAAIARGRRRGVARLAAEIVAGSA